MSGGHGRDGPGVPARRGEGRALRHRAHRRRAGSRASRPASCCRRSRSPSRSPAATCSGCAAPRSATAARYVLNGRKCFVGNSHIGDVHGVVVRTGPGSRGLTAFLVERDRPGFRLGTDGTPRRPARLQLRRADLRGLPRARREPDRRRGPGHRRGLLLEHALRPPEPDRGRARHPPGDLRRHRRLLPRARARTASRSATLPTVAQKLGEMQLAPHDRAAGGLPRGPPARPAAARATPS